MKMFELFFFLSILFTSLSFFTILFGKFGYSNILISIVYLFWIIATYLYLLNLNKK